jgi:hypothetical protein
MKWQFSCTSAANGLEVFLTAARNAVEGMMRNHSLEVLTLSGVSRHGTMVLQSTSSSVLYVECTVGCP